MENVLAAPDYAIVGIYLVAMIGLGAVVTSRIRGFRDYFLAGGALTTPLLVCTLVSTYYELDVTLGVSEVAFDYGLVAWLWLSRPYYIVIIIAALVLSTRLRRFPAMTLPDIIEHHYGLGARVLSAGACFVYSLPIVAIGGMTTVFQMLGLSESAGVITAVGVCVVYTIMGGLWADAITDTVQFVLMCVSLAIAIPFALRWVGGWDFVASLPPEHLTPVGGLSPWLIVAWTVGALTVFVEPAFYQRILAAKDARAVRRALLIGIALWASYDWGVTVIGLIGRGAVAAGLLPDGLEGKESLMAVCMHTLPVGLKGLMLGGILAAAMSSVDSYCLLASGNIVYDIIRPIREARGRPMSDRALILWTRLGVFGVMLVGVGLTSVFSRVTDAWNFMAGALVSVVFVPMVAAIVSRPRPAAGLWSAAAGFGALVAYHTAVPALGAYDPDAESWVWRVGGLQLWREYAAIVALPASAFGFAIGSIVGAPARESRRHAP